jgi:hypothetical protein
VFTARYALSPYIKQIRFVFIGLKASNCARCIASVIHYKGSIYVPLSHYAGKHVHTSSKDS